MRPYDRRERYASRRSLRSRCRIRHPCVDGPPERNHRQFILYPAPYAPGHHPVAPHCQTLPGNSPGGIVNEEGYPPIFYVMLVLGIIGIVGFFIVAAGAAGGM